MRIESPIRSSRFQSIGPIAAYSLVLSLLPNPVFADAEASEEGVAEAPADPFAHFAWTEEGTGTLGDRAKLEIPEGYRFGDSKTAIPLLQMMGNMPSDDTLALVGPKGLEWFAVFQFDDVGYIEDDESGLDADDLLRKLRSNAARGNEVRSERGLPTVKIDGWALPPTFNQETKVLEWATLATFTEPGGGEEGSSQSVNFRTKVLGRKGYMDVVVVCDPDGLEETLPAYRSMMTGFSFSDGERYDQYERGDKIAQYGLAALVTGGAVAVAAKSGLLAGLFLFLKKGIKLIVVGIAALGAFIAKLFGRKDKSL